MESQAIKTERLAKQAAKAYASALGHTMGRWQSWGGCECVRCGGVLVDTDALTFVQQSSVVALGSLSAPCEG